MELWLLKHNLQFISWYQKKKAPFTSFRSLSESAIVSDIVCISHRFGYCLHQPSFRSLYESAIVSNIVCISHRFGFCLHQPSSWTLSSSAIVSDIVWISHRFGHCLNQPYRVKICERKMRIANKKWMTSKYLETERAERCDVLFGDWYVRLLTYRGMWLTVMKVVCTFVNVQRDVMCCWET